MLAIFGRNSPDASEDVLGYRPAQNKRSTSAFLDFEQHWLLFCENSIRSVNVLDDEETSN